MNAPTTLHRKTRIRPAAGIRSGLLLLVCGALVVGGCDGLNFGVDAGDVADSGTTDEGRDGRRDTTLNLPGPGSDSCEADDKGGTCTFFGGEVVLELVAGALDGPQTISIRRAIVSLNDGDWIGYVWGPHGLPIDPPANVTVTVASDAVPSNKIILANLETAGATPTPLPSPALVDKGDGRYVLSGELSVFNTMLILER